MTQTTTYVNVSDAAHAIRLIRASIKSEPSKWPVALRDRSDVIGLTKSNVERATTGWWVPLGSESKIYADHRGTQGFARVTTSGEVSLEQEPEWWRQEEHGVSTAGMVIRGIFALILLLAWGSVGIGLWNASGNDTKSLLWIGATAILFLRKK